MTAVMSFDEAEKFFDYENSTGRLLWKNHPRRMVCNGFEAGCRLGVYRQVKVNGRKYLSHRIAWLLNYREWPENQIDHIDGDGMNNRIENLREADHLINRKNVKATARNTSGVAGVSKRGDRWEVYGTDNKKSYYLGRYRSFSDAVEVRNVFKQEHGFTERHGVKVLADMGKVIENSNEYENVN